MLGRSPSQNKQLLEYTQRYNRKFHDKPKAPYKKEFLWTDEMLEKAKKGATFNQLDRQIAEWDYRRPVRIPFSGGWAIRPFWRDKRQAPPLPWDK